MKNVICFGKKAMAGLMLAGVISTGSLLDIIISKINAYDAFKETPATSLSTVQENSLIAISSLSIKPIRKLNMVITAYSSTPEETDDTPFITASNSSVRDGIVANNLLAFGTKIRIPEIYGDKIFEVEDRMNSRMGSNRLDVWFESHYEAEKFGVKATSIEILQD